MMRSWWAMCLLLVTGAGCRLMPERPFAAAQRAMQRGAWGEALRQFDAVPAQDPVYPEARLHAAALERRLRQHEELLLEGLRMRSRWQDEAALAAFTAALELWPQNDATRALHAATRSRLQSTGPLAQQELVDVVVVEGKARGIAPEVAHGEDVDRRDVDPSAQSAGGNGPTRKQSSAQAAGGPRSWGEDDALDAVGTELAQLARRAAQGDVEGFLERLVQLNHASPDDARITVWLARMLKQRGLMSYGKGEIAAAAADWQRAMALDPDCIGLRALLAAAGRELAEPPR
jgi:tetratricopeptide (TPR) repeat protein